MKKESRIGKSIRDGMKKDFGTILHKTWGGIYTETGASDYYGTLPGGRAIYIEVKVPGARTKRERLIYQLAWLKREELLGAVAVMVTSYTELKNMLALKNIYPHAKH